MSVINTMLKDLDKRKQSHELDNLHVAPVQYQRATPSKLPWILLGLVSLVLVSGIIFSWDRLTAKVSDNTEIASGDDTTAVNKIAVNKGGTIEEPSLNPMALPSIGADNRVPVKGILDSIEPDAAVAVKSEPRLTKESSTPDPSFRSEPKNGETIESAVKPVKVEVPATRASNNASMAVTEVKLSDEQLAQKRLILATEAQSQGLQEDAIVYYSEALGLNPKLHQARKQLAALYYGQGRLNFAIELLKQGSAQFPAEYDYVLLLARVQQVSGNKQQALATLSLIPDSSMLARQKWAEQSSLAQESNDFVLAEQGYRNLLGVEANQARWWMGLGYSLDAQAKYSAAKDAYKQAVFYKSVPQKGLSAQALNYIENRLAQLGEIE